MVMKMKKHLTINIVAIIFIYASNFPILAMETTAKIKTSSLIQAIDKIIEYCEKTTPKTVTDIEYIRTINYFVKMIDKILILKHRNT